jgi:hypothetical protein
MDSEQRARRAYPQDLAYASSAQSSFVVPGRSRVTRSRLETRYERCTSMRHMSIVPSPVGVCQQGPERLPLQLCLRTLVSDAVTSSNKTCIRRTVLTSVRDGARQSHKSSCTAHYDDLTRCGLRCSSATVVPVVLDPEIERRFCWIRSGKIVIAHAILYL